MTRLELVLQSGEERPFEPYEREGFRTRFPDWPLERLLPRFSAARRENLERLIELRLQPVDLNRTGMHPALGRVTVRQLLAGWAVHDLTHLAQISRVLAWAKPFAAKARRASMRMRSRVSGTVGPTGIEAS